MRAMVLAAGLGTRLRPLTNDRPKALVEIAGRTMLDITLTRLRNFGVDEVIVNAHHFADMVVEFLETNRRKFDMRIEVSREDVLLDTGGGLKKAGWFFAGDSEPFILHNVDVISTIDLGRIVRLHQEQAALATVAVQQRKSSRYLLFDEQLRLCGRQVPDQVPELARPVQHPEALAFCGIHVISPRIFPLLTEEGVFSIIPPYVRLAAAGEKIVGFRADEYYWRDLGKPENVVAATRDYEEKVLV